jgi:hypothetical protein
VVTEPSEEPGFQGHYRRLRGSGLSHEQTVKLIEERREFREPPYGEPVSHQEHYLALIEIRDLKGERDSARRATEAERDRIERMILKGDALATALAATGRAFAEHQVDGLIEQWEEAKRA